MIKKQMVKLGVMLLIFQILIGCQKIITSEPSGASVYNRNNYICGSNRFCWGPWTYVGVTPYSSVGTGLDKYYVVKDGYKQSEVIMLGRTDFGNQKHHFKLVKTSDNSTKEEREKYNRSLNK